MHAETEDAEPGALEFPEDAELEDAELDPQPATTAERMATQAVTRTALRTVTPKKGPRRARRVICWYFYQPFGSLSTGAADLPATFRIVIK
jgi:hypothetical protein